MSLLPRLLDRATTTIEEADVLDGVASAVDSVVGRLPAGPVKDLLSGTALGHPLHPLLVTVPIGAFTSALVLDLTGGSTSAARRLIGLGLLSAVPTSMTGLSDWSDTSGAEKRVGVAHFTANAVGLSLLGGSWLVRGKGRSGVALALAGFGVIGVSGWLGGHLSYALGVGVDTTAFLRPPTEWADACSVAELEDGEPHAVTVETTPILLIRRNGEVLAIGDRCTHRGAPLHEGSIVGGSEGDCIECPWHASRFDLTDGSVVQGPATRPATVFQTRIVDGRVQVQRREERSLRLNPAG